MATRIDLTEANAEWLAEFKSRYNFTSSFLDDPRNLLRLFLGDKLEISVDEVSTGGFAGGEVVIKVSDLSRANLVTLLDVVLVHEGQDLELKHTSSTGDVVSEWGQESVEHHIEITFRPV
jgi:hypothetical protein